MSRFFPHSNYAEDQHLARTILTTHVITRSITVGTILGVTAGGIHQIIKPSAHKLSYDRIFLHSFRGILAVSSFAILGLTNKMWGKEPIEWQDRSWRLMENKGQLETDDWTYSGMAVAACFTIYKGSVKLGWKGITGALGIGNVGGVVGYLVWKYGINGGKFPKKSEAHI